MKENEAKATPESVATLCFSNRLHHWHDKTPNILVYVDIGWKWLTTINADNFKLDAIFNLLNGKTETRKSSHLHILFI